jgi:hypothetical protein
MEWQRQRSWPAQSGVGGLHQNGEKTEENKASDPREERPAAEEKLNGKTRTDRKSLQAKNRVEQDSRVATKIPRMNHEQTGQNFKKQNLLAEK